MYRYKTENLYVGLLGYVYSSNNENKRNIESIEKFIIYQKEYFEFRDYIAKDIFTNKEYFFFSGNRRPSHTIERAIGGHAILRSFPIETIIENCGKYIKKNELIELLNNLNNQPSEKENKIEEPTEKVTDIILKTILETNELVKIAEIDESLKKSIVSELENLGEYYINALTNLHNKENNDPFENEYSIRMKCMKALVEIEEKFKNPNAIKSYSLKKQLNQFKKDLNQE